MIKNPYVGMKVVPSEELRCDVKSWMSDGGMYNSPKIIDMVKSFIDCFDKDGKPYTVIDVTGKKHVAIDSAEVDGLVFHPMYFDEYTKSISIDYKRINELI